MSVHLPYWIIWPLVRSVVFSKMVYVHTWRQAVEAAAILQSLLLNSLFTDKHEHAGECERTTEELKKAQTAGAEPMQDGHSVTAALPCVSSTEELKKAQKSGAELMQDGCSLIQLAQSVETHWYAGECDSTTEELKEAQKAGAELMQERDELSAQLAGLEQQLADMTQAHDSARHATEFG